MNMAFNFNPLLAFTVLYSTLGTGMVVLPTKDPKEAIVSLSVLSANGNPTGPRDPEVYTSFDSFSCPWQTPADLSAYVAKFAKTGHDTRSTVSRPDNPNFR